MKAEPSRWERTAVGLALVAAVLLRLYDLEGKTLWSDEFHALDILRLGFWEGFRFLLFEWPHPPLSYLATYLALLFGDSDFILRLPSVAAGGATVYWTYRLGERVAGWKAGVLAAWFLALSPFHLMYSRLAVMYVWLGLWTVLSCYMFLRTLEEGGIRVTAGYALSVALLCYTHYFALWVLLAQVLFVAWRWRRFRGRLLGWALGLGAGVGLFLPWFALNLPVLMDYRSGAYWPSQFGFPLRLAFTLFTFVLGESVRPWRWEVVLPAAAVAGLAAAWTILALRHQRTEGKLFVTFAFLAILLAATALGRTLPKHLSLLLPLFWVLLALGIESAPRRSLALAAALGLVATSGGSLANYYRNREILDSSMVIPLREVASEIASGAEAGEVILVSGWSRERFARYYSGPLPVYDTFRKGEGPARHLDTARPVDVRSLESDLAPARSVWLLLVKPDFPLQRQWKEHLLRGRSVSLVRRYVPEEHALAGWREGDLHKYRFHFVELWRLTKEGDGEVAPR